MSIEYRIGGVLQVNRIEIVSADGDPVGLVTSADHGTYATGRALVDDPAGDLDLRGWQTFTADEPDCTPSRIWTGVIRDRKVGRGGRHFTGAGRVHDCVLLDVNEVLHRKIVRLNAGKRGVENDLDRLTYLLGSEATAGLISDEGLVTATPAGNLLADDLRRRYPDDIIESFAGTSGKNYFAYYDTSSGNVALFYYPNGASVWAATISISNDPADESSTCFAPDEDADLDIAPDDVYTGVSYGWLGDPIYVHSAAIAAAYGIERDAVYDTNRVGLLATAQSQAAAFLANRAGEKKVVTVTLVLPSAKVNHAYAGQEIAGKFVHLPGFEDGPTTRIRRRTVAPLTIDQYEVKLELWVPPSALEDVAVVDGATSCDDTDDLGNPITNTPSGSYGPLNSLTSDSTGMILYLTAGLTFPVKPHPGFAGNWGFPELGAGGSVDYAGDCQTNRVRIFVLGPGTITLHTAVYTDPTLEMGWELWHQEALETLDDSGAGVPVGDDIVITVPDDGYCIHWIDLAESYSPCGDKWGFGGFDWVGTAETPLPQAGDWIDESLGFGDGSTTAFVASNGFVEATFQAFVDNVDQTAGTTVTDALAGEFTLAFAPGPTEQVRVKYKSL